MMNFWFPWQPKLLFAFPQPTTQGEISLHSLTQLSASCGKLHHMSSTRSNQQPMLQNCNFRRDYPPGQKKSTTALRTMNNTEI